MQDGAPAGSSHLSILRSHDDALLEAQEALSRTRAEEILALDSSLRVLDAVSLTPELHKFVHGLLTAATKSAARVHGACEALDGRIRSHVMSAQTSVRMLAEQNNADALLAQQAFERAMAEADAVRRAGDLEQSEERARGKLEHWRTAEGSKLAEFSHSSSCTTSTQGPDTAALRRALRHSLGHSLIPHAHARLALCICARSSRSVRGSQRALNRVG